VGGREKLIYQRILFKRGLVCFLKGNKENMFHHILRNSFEDFLKAFNISHDQRASNIHECFAISRIYKKHVAKRKDVTCGYD